MGNNPQQPERRPSGLICFLNADRECGPDCMAFDDVPQSEDYKDKQWANCMLLVNAHRGGKHIVMLASIGAELQKRVKNDAADKARTNQPPPPVPK